MHNIHFIFVSVKTGKGYLEFLNAESNKLKNIPDSIGNLNSLKELNISNNNITNIPDNIGNMIKLETLNANHNYIKTLPDSMGKLTSLQKLDLGDNSIKIINNSITTINNFDIFFIYDNPLETPPLEIASKGIGAIKEYFKSLEGEQQPLNEVKVILVGDGGAGKTSLVKQLFGEQFKVNEPQTHGIIIKQKEVTHDEKDMKVNFWDFGGQEIMHATHQFFLSKRSLYVLVLDGRKEEKPEYWLKLIESFGGNSPVMIVLNKMDEHPAYDVNRAFLRIKYKSIRGFYPISCSMKTGIEEFRQGLCEELSQVEMIQTTWAKSWFKVKTILEKMKTPHISKSKYDTICRKAGISTSDARDTLVDFLNDLGLIIHFKDFLLEDTHVLEPKWVTGAVYKIINSPAVAKRKGEFELKQLPQILKKRTKGDFNYPQKMHRYIIDLMRKFELCYKLDSDKVLIPDLLSVGEPDFEFDYANSLKFILEYDFLPKSVMPRFIVKMHKDIKGELRWRTGVVLEDEHFGATAVIRADVEDDKIYIYVDGKYKRDYFTVMLFTFRSINKSFEKLGVKELIPMPDQSTVTVSYSHLLRLESKGINSYLPDGSDKEYDVKELLGNIYTMKLTEEEIAKIARKIKDDKDTVDSLSKKVGDALILQPNFMGMGADLKKLADLIKDIAKKILGK